jgi:hypothetical protein
MFQKVCWIALKQNPSGSEDDIFAPPFFLSLMQTAWNSIFSNWNSPPIKNKCTSYNFQEKKCSVWISVLAFTPFYCILTQLLPYLLSVLKIYFHSLLFYLLFLVSFLIEMCFRFCPIIYLDPSFSRIDNILYC